MAGSAEATHGAVSTHETQKHPTGSARETITELLPPISVMFQQTTDEKVTHDEKHVLRGFRVKMK